MEVLNSCLLVVGLFVNFLFLYTLINAEWRFSKPVQRLRIVFSGIIILCCIGRVAYSIFIAESAIQFFLDTFCLVIWIIIFCLMVNFYFNHKD